MISLENFKIQFAKVSDSMNSLLENEPNPFVKEKLKNIFLYFSQQLNFEIPQDIPFSNGLKAEIGKLVANLNDLKNFFPNELNTELHHITNLINSFDLYEKSFWEPAEIFLKLPSIMRLNSIDSKKIINIIKELKSSEEIKDFLKEKYENEIIIQADLEMEAKKYYNKKYDLVTLLNQIYNKKPKEQTTFEKIKSNLNKLNFFKGKSIYLSNLDYSVTYIGKIKSCALENNRNLVIKANNNTGEDAIISVCFDDLRVTKAKITNKSYKTLKEMIFSYYMCLEENNFALKETYITKNKDFMYQKTSVLDDGYYNVIVGRRFRIGTGHYLIFQNTKNGKTTEFEIYDGGLDVQKQIKIKDATIKHKDWNSACFFDEFLKYFKVLSEEDSIMNFSSEVEANSHFNIKDNKIAENESYEIVKKTQEIHDIQSYVICLLIENEQNGSLFNFLIDKLLSLQNYKFNDRSVLEQINNTQTGKAVLEGIMKVLEIKKSLGYETCELKILTEVVNECNYTRLINKEQGIKTERLMSLLTQGKQITDEMKGKTIIAFFGNTGSGKSTTVNFFSGVPLIITKNNFGDKIIKINEGFQGNSAKIGHSLGTSETLYAQSYEIKEDTYEEETIPKQNLKDLFICDNPGFRDTRGSDFEICTNLSIDQAILNCKKLQAAVLVLPYSVFSLDRGNHLIDAINNFKERFPDMLESRSSTQSSIFIAITKYNSVQQIEGFEGRLTTHIDEESKNLAEFSRNKEDQSKIYFYKDKLEIFNSLMSMYKSNQIFFINIEDKFQREEQFSEIYKRQGIDKRKYNRSMEGSEMLKKFSEEINKTCHTWHKLILERYLTTIPKELQKLRDSIQAFLDGIGRKKKEIEEIKNSISKLEQEITNLKAKLNQGLGAGELPQDFEDEEIKAKRKELMQLQEKLQSLKIKLEQKQEDYDSKIKEIAETDEKSKSIRQKVDNYSKGETVNVLVDDSCTLGKKYFYMTNHKQDVYEALRESLRDVKPLEIDGDTVSYIAGTKNIKLLPSVYVEKKYCLVPEKTNFDEEGMLAKYQGGAFYKAKIESNLCKLTGVNASPCGKKIVIQYEKELKIGTDLPYLKITHTIPNEKVYSDIIVNLNSEINELQSKISTLQKYKDDLATEKNRLNQDINNLQKQINEINEIIKKIISAKSKELKIKQIKELIEILKKRILEFIEQIKRKEKEIEEDEKRLAEARRDLSIKEKEHKTLALLIWDQLEKKIPQSLFDYIQIAYDIESERDASKDHENITDVKKQQKVNFEAFKNVFSREIGTLKDRVSQHLKII